MHCALDPKFHCDCLACFIPEMRKHKCGTPVWLKVFFFYFSVAPAHRSIIIPDLMVLSSQLKKNHKRETGFKLLVSEANRESITEDKSSRAEQFLSYVRECKLCINQQPRPYHVKIFL